MPYLTFVVKGPEEIAREQMRARGIAAKTVGFTRTETVFKANTDYLDKISQWFGEEEKITPGIGYPDGTCLIYSTHENG